MKSRNKRRFYFFGLNGRIKTIKRTNQVLERIEKYVIESITKITETKVMHVFSMNNGPNYVVWICPTENSKSSNLIAKEMLKIRSDIFNPITIKQNAGVY